MNEPQKAEPVEFRLRGLQTTRIETLTDAAFAFAFTLLVIGQGKIPASYAELQQALLHIPAFAVSVALLGTFWFRHHIWSRRTGLDDSVSVALSFSLVLLVLIYVYPLKAVFSSMFHWVSGGWLPSGIRLASEHELAGLFVVYSLGYLGMMLCIVLLNRHALKARLPLPLNPYERTVLGNEIRLGLVLSVVALISVLIGLFAEGAWILLGGFIYAVLGILVPLTVRLNNRRLKLLLAAQQADIDALTEPDPQPEFSPTAAEAELAPAKSP